jgi:hypothetical protein
VCKRLAKAVLVHSLAAVEKIGISVEIRNVERLVIVSDVFACAENAGRLNIAHPGEFEIYLEWL